VEIIEDHVKENRYSWDATSFADGRYPAAGHGLRTRRTTMIPFALTATSESEPFLIDNTPPQIEGLTAKAEGGKLVESRFRRRTR